MEVASEQETSAAATRDAGDGAIERAAFRGSPGQRVFTFLHLPPSPSRGAVVVCPPLLGEFARNYRREVLLARRLMHLGFAALRFHYRYTGNSDGEGSGLTFGSMVEDALESVEQLRGEAPDGPLFLLGTRWSALIAASAASRHPDAAVVLWEPLLDAGAFYKDAFRSRLVRQLRTGTERPPTRKELEERLQAGEAVDAVAYTLEPALYRSAIERTLEGELGSARRRMLVVQVGPTGIVRPDLARHVERWREQGLEVDAEAARGDESWWLVDENHDDETKRAVTRELVRLTADWVAGHAPEGGRR